MSQVPTPQFSPAHDTRLTAPRVLVVEDDMTIALLIEDIICELSFEVAAVVPRLKDAMRLLDSETFDMAMLDVHLNGEVVFPFAAGLEAREIPFLFATADGRREIPAAFAAHLVLQKPFAPAELRRALLTVSGLSVSGLTVSGHGPN